MSHSKISPSSSKRWMVCPGSVKLIESLGLEPKGSQAADLGTRIHALGEFLIKQQYYHYKDAFLNPEYSKDLTKEDYREGQAYFNYVKSVADQDELSLVLCEVKVDMPEISENLYGTVDCAILQDNKLHIIDLKTGANPVNATRNTQLMIYAYGVLSTLSRNPSYSNDIKSVEEITLHIFQKNSRIHSDNINTYTLSRVDLENFMQNEVKSVIEEIFSDNPRRVANEKACQYCPASSRCDVLYKSITDSIQGEFDSLDEACSSDNVKSLEISKLEDLLEKKKMITDYLDSLEVRLYEFLMSGGKSTKFKLVEKTTKRTWKNEIEAYEYLKSVLDEDEFAPRKLMTPTQCLDVVMDKDALNEFIYKPEGALTIAHMSNKKEAKNPISADFDKLS